MRESLKLTLILFFLLASQLAFSQTVYITRTGEKYHDDGCRYLSKSKIQTTLQDAKANGYTACSVCKPTSTVTPASTLTPSPQKITARPSTAPARKAKSSQCTARTKAGARCSRMTTTANGKCWQH